jgi:hypothetical protein
MKPAAVNTTAQSHKSGWLSHESEHGVQGSYSVFAFTLVTPSLANRFLLVLWQLTEVAVALTPVLITGHDTVECLPSQPAYLRSKSKFPLISLFHHSQTNKTNSVAWVLEKTIPSDRRLSAKLVSIYADKGLSRSQRGGSPTAVIPIFKTRDAAFSYK